MTRRLAGVVTGGLLVFLILQSPACASSGERGGQLRRVRVMVVDSKTRKRLPGARVFVLSEAGKILADTKTDELGLASLDDETITSRQPQYVLAQDKWYFLMGRDWLPGQQEYYMPLVPLTPPGFQ